MALPFFFFTSDYELRSNVIFEECKMTNSNGFAYFVFNYDYELKTILFLKNIKWLILTALPPPFLTSNYELTFFEEYIMAKSTIFILALIKSTAMIFVLLKSFIEKLGCLKKIK